MKKITVVIPYFQRERGILSRALMSALAQQGSFKLEILVVDDASPVPAREEIASLTAEQQSSIRIVEQANGGPAAARNTALNHVDGATEYVAFLDSDDEWTPDHLANGLLALEQGFDFYFTDHYQLNQTVSAFARARRIQVDQHPRIAGQEHLHRYQGDMFDQILRGNIIGTSTVMYRFSRFPALRFREEFVYAGEDYLFWLDLVRQTDRIAFSSQCECRYGRGVNVFAGSGWGTEKSLQRTHYEMKFKKALLSLYDLNEVQAHGTRQAVSRLRQHFVADVLHRLMHRKSMDNVMLKHLRVDARSFLYFVPLAVRVLVERARGKENRSAA